MTILICQKSLLPDFLQNERTTKLIFEAEKKKDPDDPVTFIQWNKTMRPVANCRNGVPGQTQAALVDYIVNCDSVNFNRLNNLFLFRIGPQVTTCQYGFPLWYEKTIISFISV